MPGALSHPSASWPKGFLVQPGGIHQDEINWEWYAMLPARGRQHHDCPAGLSERKTSVVLHLHHPEGIADDSRQRLLPCHQTDDERKGLQTVYVQKQKPSIFKNGGRG